mmetsp:Transcript_3624/g.5395  ORF Transcript_3624/g.5395 Transcript_3624/m.5395 type:complete len:410 (-) Transcript_3624:162-1391(-)
MRAIYTLTCILIALKNCLPANAVVDSFMASGESEYFSSQSAKTQLRFFVENKGDKTKTKSDAIASGGKVVHELDTVGKTVVEFGNLTDASHFSSLGYSGEMNGDTPRFLMARRKTSLQARGLQFNGQIVPTGIQMVFQNTMPNSSYYPSTTVHPICIIDSGVAPHPDLQDASVAAADSSTSYISNGCSHGTHVSGTIYADNNDVGVVGIFPGASIMSMKVFDGSSCSWTYSSDIIAAAEACVASGAKIVTMSLGGQVSSSTEEAAFSSLKDQGILVIAAAGNTGANQYLYPAAYSSVVSVAAVDDSYNLASFSTYNDQVDIAAPGVNVLSTVSASDGYYEYLSGTSMATPHVSGIAFLLWNKYPSCTSDQILEALLSTAKDLGASGTDNNFGAGFVQYWSAEKYLSSIC